MRIAVIDDEKYSRLELIHQIRQHLPQMCIRDRYRITRVRLHRPQVFSGSTVLIKIATPIRCGYFYKVSQRPLRVSISMLSTKFKPGTVVSFIKTPKSNAANGFFFTVLDRF